MTYTVAGTDSFAVQSALDNATDDWTRSATVYFPPGFYDLDDPIVFRHVDHSADPQITLTLTGAARAPLAWRGAAQDPSGYSVIRSSGGFSGGTYPAFNNVSVNVRDLLCVAPDNPDFTFWNLDSCQGGGVSGVLGVTESCFSGGTIVEPTHAASYFAKLPHYGLSNYTYVDGLIVAGFHTGLRQTDLAVTRGLGVGWCKVGVEIPAHQHASLIEQFHCSATQVPIKVTGDAYVDILHASIEHNEAPFPAWTHTTYDLDDPGNHLRGHVRWFTVSGPPIMVPEHTFTVNGGLNATHQEIGSPLPSAPPVTGGPTSELDYAPRTTSMSVTATSQLTAQTVVTGHPLEWDGETTALVEFSVPYCGPDAGAVGRSMLFWLYDGNSSVAALGAVTTPAAKMDRKPVHLSTRITPSAGTHTYSVRASVSAGVGTIDAGPGNPGTYVPAYLRVTGA